MLAIRCACRKEVERRCRFDKKRLTFHGSPFCELICRNAASFYKKGKYKGSEFDELCTIVEKCKSSDHESCLKLADGFIVKKVANKEERARVVGDVMAGRVTLHTKSEQAVMKEYAVEFLQGKSNKDEEVFYGSDGQGRRCLTLKKLRETVKNPEDGTPNTGHEGPYEAARHFVEVGLSIV